MGPAPIQDEFNGKDDFGDIAPGNYPQPMQTQIDKEPIQQQYATGTGPNMEEQGPSNGGNYGPVTSPGKQISMMNPFVAWIPLMQKCIAQNEGQLTKQYGQKNIDKICELETK